MTAYRAYRLYQHTAAYNCRRYVVVAIPCETRRAAPSIVDVLRSINWLSAARKLLTAN
jgi:hypothetical protein